MDLLAEKTNKIKLMEVQIWLPKKAKLGVVEKEYPNACADGDEKHDDLSYFVGKSMDESNSRDFLTYQQAVECCGFVEGAIPGSECVIEGNGGWAMGMIKREDFSGLAVSPQQKSAYKRRSNTYWKAFKRGKRLSANAEASEPPTCGAASTQRANGGSLR